MSPTSVSQASPRLPRRRSSPRALRLRRHLQETGLLCLLVAGLTACGGKSKVRFDTFGDETKWTDALRMNEVVATVDPTTALSVGLKVDSEALPSAVERH